MFRYRQSLSKEIQVELIDLVHTMITDGNLKFAQILRNALVEKVCSYVGWVLCSIYF